MDEMELLQAAEDAMQDTAASEASTSRRRRSAPARFHFTAASVTTAFGKIERPCVQVEGITEKARAKDRNLNKRTYVAIYH